jgi:hypothetical protein
VKLRKREGKSMREIHEIASDIKREWRKPYFGAVPYLNAMHCLRDKTSMYICDSAETIVETFLSNATSFRGEKAKALKTELKQHLK